MWLVAGVALAVCACGAVAQDANFVGNMISLMGTLRPSQTVIRTVKAAAPELFVSLEERMRAWGYPLETHRVRTEDGYLLTLHRIPRGRRGADSNATAARAPVLMQHGIISCSEYWVLEGPDKSPGLILADQGYDVWLNNVRGNHYSKKHERMGRRDKQFWKFSWHEMGMYDIPAVIDYILNTTAQEKLFYVSHSMGNTLFYVAMSMRPEYNAKIRLQVALAPAVFLNESLASPTQLVVANADFITNVVDALPTYEILTKTETSIAINYLLCNNKAFFSKICAVIFSWIVGAMDLNSKNNLSLVMARSSSSTSAIVAMHFLQISRSGEFAQMDHGRAENLRVYGAPLPPKYPLERVSAPAAIYAADADVLVPPKGIERLVKALPNVVLYKVIKETFFNHMDFVTHPRVKELLMDHVVEVMARF